MAAKLIALNTHIVTTYRKFKAAADEKHYTEKALWKILFFAIKMKRYMKRQYPLCDNTEERNTSRIWANLKLKAVMILRTNAQDATAELVRDYLYECNWRWKIRSAVRIHIKKIEHIQVRVRHQSLVKTIRGDYISELFENEKFLYKAELTISNKKEDKQLLEDFENFNH